MPSLRNAFFTGRATLLTQLRTTFLASHANIVVQVLSGLGGIGKTQIALEYVYRYRHTYQAVCWVTAYPHGDLLADFVNIARVQSGKAANCDPVLRLLIDHPPGWQVIGHHAPGSAGSRNPARAFEDFAQAVGALPGVFGQ